MSLEQKHKERLKRTRVREVIMGVLAASALVASALVVPGVIRILKHIDPEWTRKLNPNQRVSQALYALKKKGLVNFEVNRGKKYLALTKRGRREAEALSENRFVFDRPARWDGKWRLVVFDISEKKRMLRNQLRSILKRIGFVRLQDSVWVFPYDCEEILILVKTRKKLGKSVLYAIVDVLENDTPLKKYFAL